MDCSWAVSAIKQEYLSGIMENVEENDKSPLEELGLQKVMQKNLFEDKKKLEILRLNPNSPLYYNKTFEEMNLRPELLKGIYMLEFNAPSKIQEKTLPGLLADPPINLIAQSQSGTGKTAAFLIAMLSRINIDCKWPQALCLSPTYELAVQTGNIAKLLAQYMPQIEFAYAIRGVQRKRGEQLTQQVIIGTPGKMLDWALKLKLFDLTRLKIFVLDEADVMISNQGSSEQVHRIRRGLNPKCQKILFSATYADDVMQFAKSIIPDAAILGLKREEESLENIKQFYVKCADNSEKYTAITNIYGVITIGQAIIFCQTRKTAGWLAVKMTADGHSVALLSAELTVDQRQSVLERFRLGKEKVLIATSVLSRGIDIAQVTIVINFDLPLDGNQLPDCETYLHRIGRTGRFGKPGLAINLIKDQKDFEAMKTIQDHFKRTINLVNVHDIDEMDQMQD